MPALTTPRGPSVEELVPCVVPLDRPTVAAMKGDAQTLKAEMRAAGYDAKHCKILEAVARANGFRTWAAALAQAPAEAPISRIEVTGGRHPAEPEEPGPINRRVTYVPAPVVRRTHSG